MQIAKGQINKGLVKPDLLPFLVDPCDLKARVKVWMELGRILPISMYGSDRDNRLSPRSWVDPPPPDVPRNTVYITLAGKDGVRSAASTRSIQEILLLIGDTYMAVGSTGDALNLYLEAFYSLPHSGNPELRGRLWLKIAEIEKSRGNRQLALHAYLKAAYNWHECAEQAKKGAADVLSEGEPQETTSAEPKLQKDVAATIASLYAKLNLHPLALAVLERSEKDAGEDMTADKIRIRKEWEDILKWIVGAGGKDCYVLGQNVPKVKDWARIPLLRPTDTFWK